MTSNQKTNGKVSKNLRISSVICKKEGGDVFTHRIVCMTTYGTERKKWIMELLKRYYCIYIPSRNKNNKKRSTPKGDIPYNVIKIGLGRTTRQVDKE